METRALGRALFWIGLIIMILSLVISAILHLLSDVSDDTLFTIGAFASIGLAMLLLSLIIAMFHSQN
ncbi:MAG TPA: hypothetical protein PL070_08675 [Flavobacteriales bacterium]|nr:hypothetical protein [Flavobacteriales bacterium]